MENGFSPEHRESQPEIVKSGIDELSEQLGFIESDELRAIREQAIEASFSNDTERVSALLEGYQLQAEALVSAMQGSDYMRAQIALIISKATLNRDTGNLEAFLNDISDAKEYAFNTYEDEAVSVLERAPSTEIARILFALGNDFGFDMETVNEIATAPYGQAFQTAYSYLMQAGLDADEYLSAFMSSPE